jgi:phage terminase large subunit-like protein
VNLFAKISEDKEFIKNLGLEDANNEYLEYLGLNNYASFRSSIDIWARNNPNYLSQLIAHYGHEYIKELSESPTADLRPKQHITQPDHLILFYGARGFGKTHAAVRWLRSKINKPRHKKELGLITSIQDQSITEQVLEPLLETYHPSEYTLNKKSLILYFKKYKCKIYCVSSINHRKARGYNLSFAYVDELAAFTNFRKVWQSIKPAVRIGDNPQILMSTSPDHTNKHFIDVVNHLRQTESILEIRGSSFENNTLPIPVLKSYLAEIDTTYGQEEYLALDIVGRNGFAPILFDNIFQSNAPNAFDNITIAIDPAFSDNVESETGIVIAGRINNHIYILEDLSANYDINTWPKLVNEKYTQYSKLTKTKPTVFIETNHGSKQLAVILRNINMAMNIQEHRTDQNKATRAEPYLYALQKGLITFVGPRQVYGKLIQQCITFDPQKNKSEGKSPDRLDSISYAVSHLLSKNNSYTPNLNRVGSLIHGQW